jgi:hypothetical protein
MSEMVEEERYKRLLSIQRYQGGLGSLILASLGPNLRIYSVYLLSGIRVSHCFGLTTVGSGDNPPNALLCEGY